MRHLVLCKTVFAIAFLALGAQSAFASYSFTGSFASDSDVQLFNFSTSGGSDITLHTLSFAGGTNFTGNTIAAEGFVPALFLFDSTGSLLTQTTGKNTCGSSNPAPPDSLIGACWDEYLVFDSSHLGQLSAGNYTLALAEWGNSMAGSTLADGFTGLSTGNPAFYESLSSTQLDGHWAVDLLQVDTASLVVPEPTTLSLAVVGFASVFINRRRSIRA